MAVSGIAVFLIWVFFNLIKVSVSSSELPLLVLDCVINEVMSMSKLSATGCTRPSI